MSLFRAQAVWLGIDDARRFLLVFHVLPQGRPIVHRFCTAVEVFDIAEQGNLAESRFSENVRVPELAG